MNKKEALTMKAEQTNNTQEAAISCQTMLELMGLPSEAKKKLALMLMGGELDTDDQAEDHRRKVNSVEPESFFEICNTMMDLSLRIKRMRAVAECFADDYVDTCNGITCAMAVAHTEEHYESLFNALFELIAAVDEQAEKLHHDMDEIYKEA